MNDKRFYWIKLKTDFFDREDIDFLLSQENGCQYVVLYQMLCLNTANSNGFLENKINEVIIPYDIKKIVRDTKYFDYDTVAVALELFKKLGLIYEQENKILKISNFEDMVGSEAGNANAQRQKRYRERQKQIKLQSVTPCVTENNEEYRDKSIEYRDIDNKSIDNKYKYIVEYLNKKTGKHFKTNSAKTKTLIKARLNEGYTEKDFIKVIDIKTNEWLKTKMEQYLRPETLFSNKFEGYLNQSSSSPSWLNKEIEKEEVSDEELKELQEIMRGHEK